MPETFTRWDAVEHVSTKEDVRLYLEACVEEDLGDGSLIRAALHDIARAQNMSLLARDVGMSREGQPQLCGGHADHAGTGHAVASYGVAVGLPDADLP